MDINFEHLTKEHTAKLLGCSIHSVDLYVKQKDDPLTYRDDEGKFKYYVWSEVFAWRLRREVRKAPKQDFDAKDEINEAKLQGQNLINEKLQIELDTRKSHLLEEADVKQVWSDALVSIRQALLNVGHTAATDITSNMTYSKKKKLIDALVFQNLEQVIKEVKKASHDAS
jgi:hypothetical protein